MSEKHQDTKGAKCSFCGKSQAEVAKLLAAPGVYICDGCVYLCNEILSEELSADWAKEAALAAAHSERYALAERLVSMEHIGLELRSEAEGVLLEALRGKANCVG